MADGSHIEIEERPGEEVTVLGGVRLAPEASPGFNPAFDVTPARLVDAVATERGVAEPRTGTDLRALAEGGMPPRLACAPTTRHKFIASSATNEDMIFT